MQSLAPPPKTAPSAADVAASMYYEHRLNQLGREFAARNLAPVIVKGRAIVDLAFPKGEIRLSGDVDLLVSDDSETVVSALRELGYDEVKEAHSRHFGFGERGFHQSGKRLPIFVEVHNCLDKILLRPIPYADILARAKPSGRDGFRYPSIEDLLLLVVLHASADIRVSFDPKRVERDLWYLIHHGKPDMDIVWRRAQQWELSRALSRLVNGQYPQEKNRPSSRGQAAAYLTAQLSWHDNPVTVMQGLIRYSRARLLDRLFP